MPCYNRDPKKDHNFDNPYAPIKWYKEAPGICIEATERVEVCQDLQPHTPETYILNPTITFIMTIMTGIMEKNMETTIVCWGYIGIMENKMETTKKANSGT